MVEKRGNLKFYSINQNYSLYEEYKNIITKTVGVEDKLKRILKSIKGVKSACIYGSYVMGTMEAHSDIDLLVVGNQAIIVLQRKLRELQNQIGREINVINISAEEFEKKKKKKDPFILGVFRRKHIKLL